LIVEVGVSFIVWTRAKEDWQRDLSIVEKQKIDLRILVHIPCVSFSQVPLSGSVPAANYVIFHSSNAVRFAMANDKLAAAIRMAVKIFAIGKGTSETMKDFGLSSTPGFAANSAKQLADQILQSGVGGTFLIPTAKESAFDSAAYLRSHGRVAAAVPCYETKRHATKANGSDFTSAEILAEGKKLSGIICFASPSAVEGFCNVFNVKTSGLNKNLLPVAIGSTTQNEVIKHFETCYRSEQSSVSSLLEEAQKQFLRMNGVRP
jgi:uroporphyrinogen-III synthase